VAAEAEMKQLHFRKTFEPMHWKELSHTVLESHMFLKEKRDGKNKRENCGRRKQTAGLHLQRRCKLTDRNNRICSNDVPRKKEISP
jgi:hypothetical protein